MKNVYYITNSTIFNKEEEIVKALNNGEVIRTDDANLTFTKKFNKLVVKKLYTLNNNEGWSINIFNWNDTKEVISVIEDACRNSNNI